MTVKSQIRGYIASLSDAKRTDVEELHRSILAMKPGCKLWFLDGTNAEGKIVSNPNIGYGSFNKQYADGSTTDFYRVGLSANTSGISVYIMGIDDKKYLSDTYAKDIGKASVTGYCIKFKKLADINLDVLETAIRTRLEVSS
jgi:hypothetical protein